MSKLRIYFKLSRTPVFWIRWYFTHTSGLQPLTWEHWIFHLTDPSHLIIFPSWAEWIHQTTYCSPEPTQSICSLSIKSSYHKILWSIDATISVVETILSLRNFEIWWESICKVFMELWIHTSLFQDYIWSYVKMCYCLIHLPLVWHVSVNRISISLNNGFSPIQRQHLRNYIHQHRPITAFWLVFSTFLYKKFCLNIGH